MMTSNDLVWLKSMLALIQQIPPSPARTAIEKRYSCLVDDVAEVPGRLIMMIDAKTFADVAELDAAHEQEIIRAIKRWSST
jgi:hypothetical protein